MAISAISNGESSSSVRTKINSSFTQLNALGDASTKNVGTTAGTVAAGNDPRLTRARTALTFASSITPNCDDGLSRSVTLTGDCVIGAPTNPVDGYIIRLKFLASGADRELTFNSSIKLPTGITYEATVVAGSTRIIELEYNGTSWMMIKNLEFVA